MIDMCDNWLCVDCIELMVFVDNEFVVVVYKKYGFEIEGIGKKYGLCNGEYVDVYFMVCVKQCFFVLFCGVKCYKFL